MTDGTGGTSGRVCGGSYLTNKENIGLLRATCGGRYSIDARRTEIGFRCAAPMNR